MRLIEEAPERHPVNRGCLIRVLLRRITHGIHFEVDPSTISVVGVIRGRRHPPTRGWGGLRPSALLLGRRPGCRFQHGETR